MFGPKLLLLLALTPFLLFSGEKHYSLPDPKTQEEALFLRRISEFWNDGEYEIVKSQMLGFIEEYPDSGFCPILHGILGDLYMKEKNYPEALLYYGGIQEEGFAKEFLLNKLQCLRELGRHPELTQECEKHLDTFLLSDPKKHHKLVFLLAEALYFQALQSPRDSDEKKAFASQAKTHYESLAETDCAKEAMPPLAYLYHLLGETEKAAELYLAIAEKDPTKKEEMLFQAASLQAEFDKEKALQTFGQICHLSRGKVAEAAFNRAVLLYDLKRYPEVLLAKDQYLSLIPKNKLPLFHFFVGRSYFALEDFKKASSELLQFLEGGEAEGSELQIGLVTLLDCATKLEDNLLFEKILKDFQKKFPNSTLDAKIFFTKAMMNKKLLKYREAREDFEHLFQKYPGFENREVSLYEFAHLLYLLQDWEMCRARFNEFLTSYQDSSFSPLAWRFFINAAIEHESKSRDPVQAKQQLVQDLSLVLKQNRLLTEKEREEMSYMLAKICYETEDFPAAIDLLTRLLQDKPQSPLSPDLHLLLAYCYKKGQKDLEQFCLYAEKALALQTSLQDADTLHLNLYNAYLELGEKNAQKHFWDEAADHLYQAYQNGVKIQETNEVWLCGFYYAKVKQFLEKNWWIRLEESAPLQAAAQKAVLLLEKRKERAPHLASENLKLAEIYGMQANREKEQKILEDLHALVLKENTFSQEEQKEIRFALAKFYAKIAFYPKAVILFDELRQNPMQDDKDVYSCLESARLRFAIAQESAPRRDDPEVIQALSQLKDLMIQRTFAYEPLHLEAAFAYIDILSSLDQGIEREHTKILLLEKTISDFESEGDILSKEYHNARKRFPEKENIYLSYLSLMDAELLFAKANLAHSQAKPDEEKICRDGAQSILRELEKYPITPYFQSRVMKNLKSL